MTWLNRKEIPGNIGKLQTKKILKERKSQSGLPKSNNRGANIELENG